jgi:hypothetical protein
MAKEEYLRRNVNVAKAYGARAAVDLAIKRARSVKRFPRWALDFLESASERLTDLPSELAAYRNLESKTP